MIKTYLKFLENFFRGEIEHRFSFFINIFINIFTNSILYLNIWILLNRFDSIFGWSFYEIMFLFNLNLFSYGFSGLFFWIPMKFLNTLIQRGEFDNVLLKPINPLSNLIFRYFSYGFIGHLILGSIIFLYSMTKLEISWTLLNVIWFIAIIIGAILIQASLLIATGSLSFWILNATAVTDTAIFGFRMFLNYPMSIYDRWIQVFLTFVLPIGFINFYPAHIFIGGDDKLGVLFHPFLRYGTPVVGIIMFSLALIIWKIGIKKYNSTGS